MQATFESLEQNSPDIVTFWFKPEHVLKYNAGQFIELTIQHVADQRGQSRWFTLSSSPRGSLVSITTRLANVPSSFKASLRNLTAGDIVDISQPMGDFVLPKDRSIPLLFAVAGIGITPVKSIQQCLSDTAETREIVVLYAVRREADVVFEDIINKAKATLKIMVSRPLDPTIKPTRLTAKEIITEARTMNNPIIYLSGPEELIETLVVDIRKRGVKDSRLVTDYFQGYGLA